MATAVLYLGEDVGARILKNGVGIAQVGDAYQLDVTTWDVVPGGEMGDVSFRSIDVSLALITHSPELTVGGSIDIVVAVRRIALDLFPGSGDTFDMIYRPRLMRAIVERFGLDAELPPEAAP